MSAQLLRACTVAALSAACAGPAAAPPGPPLPPTPAPARSAPSAASASASPLDAGAKAPEPLRYDHGPELAFQPSSESPRVTPLRRGLAGPKMWSHAGVSLLSDHLHGNPSTLITAKGKRAIPYQPSAVWISPDAELVALEDADDAGLVVLSATRGAKLASFPLRVCAARWTSDQTLVLLTRPDSAMVVEIRAQRWDRGTGVLSELGKEHAAHACALAADGKSALLRAPDGQVVALDLESDRARSLWEPPTDRVEIVLSPAADRVCRVPPILNPGPLECVTIDGRRERLLDHFGGRVTLEPRGTRAIAHAIARGESSRSWLVDFDAKTIRPFGPRSGRGVLTEGGTLYAEVAGKDRLRVFDFEAGVTYESSTKLVDVDAIVGQGRRLLGMSDGGSSAMLTDAHLVEVPPSEASGR